MLPLPEAPIDSTAHPRGLERQRLGSGGLGKAKPRAPFDELCRFHFYAACLLPIRKFALGARGKAQISARAATWRSQMLAWVCRPTSVIGGKADMARTCQYVR